MDCKENKLASLTSVEEAKYGQSVAIYRVSLNGNNKLSVSDSEKIKAAQVKTGNSQVHKRVPERMLNRRYTI